MPIYQLHCPQCGHHFSGMVFAHTRMPELWVCSQCGSKQAKLLKNFRPLEHPLDTSQGGGCPCCGGAPHSKSIR